MRSARVDGGKSLGGRRNAGHYMEPELQAGLNNLAVAVRCHDELATCFASTTHVVCREHCAGSDHAIRFASGGEGGNAFERLG